MKNLKFIFIVLVIGLPLVNQAQDLKFETLKLNSSPAFVVLGVEPDNIQRPSTPTKFVAGLQNALINGELKPNVAFEISPYYMANPLDSSNQRFDASYYLLDKKSFFQTVARTFSLSLATSASDSVTFGTLESSTALGLGARFLLVDGKANQALKIWHTALIQKVFYQRLSALAKTYYETSFETDLVIEKAVDDLKNIYIPGLKVNSMSDKELEQFISQQKKDISYQLKSSGAYNTKTEVVAYIQEKYNQSITSESEKLATLNQKTNPLAKQGFMLEMAFGQALVFENSTYQGLKGAKTAFWFSPSYRWDATGKNPKQIFLIDILGVMRYTINNQSAGVDVANYFDAGLKGAITLNRLSAGVEYVYRYASKTPIGFTKNYTYRLSTGIDYKLTDGITFKFNFGTNFDGNTSTYTNPKQVFAIGGLNLGIASFLSNKSAN